MQSQRQLKKCFLLLQLDDWVLCRVQQRGNRSKNTCNSQDSYSTEFWRYLPKVEQTQPTYANLHADIITDFLYKDCQLLASILSGQAPSPTETNSSVSFQGSKDSYEVRSNNMVKSTISISSSGIDSNTLKMKSTEENMKENHFPLINNRENKKIDENLLPSMRPAGNAINCYIPNHSQYDLLNAQPTDPTNFEEFNEMTFPGTYFE